MASMSQVQCCLGHELGVMGGNSSMASNSAIQATHAEPNGADPIPNGAAGTHIPNASPPGTPASSLVTWWLDIGYVGKLLRWLWVGTPSSGTTPTATGSPYSSWMAQAFAFWSPCAADGQQTKATSWSKVIAFVACITTIVAFWPAHQAAMDGARSLALTRWTAKKDFYEFCEAVSTTTGRSV
jgi:hypothetical protein